MTELAELRARGDQVAREWHSAEQGELQAFGRLHEQVIAVGQRRLELSMQIAQIEGPPSTAGKDLVS